MFYKYCGSDVVKDRLFDSFDTAFAYGESCGCFFTIEEFDDDFLM